MYFPLTHWIFVMGLLLLECDAIFIIGWHVMFMYNILTFLFLPTFKLILAVCQREKGRWWHTIGVTVSLVCFPWKKSSTNKENTSKKCQILLMSICYGDFTVIELLHVKYSWILQIYVWISTYKVDTRVCSILKNHTQFLTVLTPYLRIRALAERAEFVRLPNDDISNEIPRFASVQSNYIA